MIGKTILHYNILEKLGEGGMGVVYKAEDTKLQRTVAIKFLPQDLTRNTEAKQRFIHEARTASALDHSNICTIHEINETEDGHLFIVMAYYDDESLKHKIEQAPLNSTEAIGIALQVAEGLKKAHSKGIIHRDIKPSNIMLTSDGIVKIVDFGLAKLTRGQRLTVDGKTMGTIAYMSPEQTRGDDVDERSDIWSLGVVLYEMLTGHLPFQGESDVALIYSINNEEPTPTKEYRKEIDESLSTVVHRCLEKNPEDRYQNIAEFLGDIQLVVDGYAVPMKKRRRARSLRQRLLTATKYGVLPILFALIAVAYWYYSRSRPTNENLNSQVIAVMPFAYSGTQEFAYLAEGMLDLLSTSLDGAGQLRTVDPRAIYIQTKALKGQEVDAQRANDIARRFSAGLCLLGTIVEMRGQLRLSASLYETTSSRKAVQQVAVDGDADRIFNLVDQMTTQIITERFGKPSQQLESIGVATTRSIPALKAYLAAIQADREGLLEKEYDLLKEAVQADSTFAMAWLELSLYCWGWAANMEEARFAMTKAKKYGTKLNERYQYNIDGLNHLIKGENLMAYDVYRELLQKYPDDINGYIVLCANLFVTNYLYGRSIFESVDYFNKWIALDPQNGTAYQGILPLILQGKKLNEIDAVIAKIIEVSPSHELAWQYTTPRAFIADDQAGLKQALIEAKSKRDFEVRFMAWQICVVAPESDAADPFIQILTQPNQPLVTRLCGYHTLAFMHSGKGKIHLAMTELDTAAALQPAAGLIFRAFICSLPFFRVPREELEKIRIALEQWPAEKEKNIQASELIQSMPVNIYPQTRLYLLGLVHSALGQFDQVEKYAIALKRMTTPYDEASIVEQWAITLQVLAAMSRGEDDRALALLQSSDVRIRFSLFNYNFYSFAYQRYLRGVLLCRLNRPQEALPWFLCVFQMIDSPVTAQARLRCAEACEKLGRNEEAKKYYREFIAIWKNSDPELQPEVAKAQERLSKIP